MGKGYKGEGGGICLQNIIDLHLGLAQVNISSDFDNVHTCSDPFTSCDYAQLRYMVEFA